MNVVDSSGWVEYLQDSPRAAMFADAIEDRHRLLVPTIALYEVHKILSRVLQPALVAQSIDVMRRGRVVDFTDARAIAASEIALRYKLAMADAAMYSVALEFGATFWTQYADYQGLAGVKYWAKPRNLS